MRGVHDGRSALDMARAETMLEERERALKEYDRIMAADAKERDRQRYAEIVATDAAKSQLESDAGQHQPVATADRSQNVLRPWSFDDVVGQARAKSLLKRMVDNAKARRVRLDHMLMVGPSGTGKTTLAHVVAHELGAEVYQVEAPISTDTLLELRVAMSDGDVLFIDEIHQQAIGERRGKSASTQPEVLFGVMEDFTIATASGVLPFPKITVMGATTDEGMLPDAFVNRFPIRPRLERYTREDMKEIAHHNARALFIRLNGEAADIFAGASRGVPREINNFVRNAASLTQGMVKRQLALEVVQVLNGTTLDGLTLDMQNLLKFLYLRCRRERQDDGRVTYQASVSTIATAIGKSRDQKAVQLRVEPYLIERGYIQVGPAGRFLTDEGVLRAQDLLMED